MDFRVPFVNYKKYYSLHEEEIISTAKRVLSRGDLILRDDVEQFERDVAGFCGVDYAVGVNSGTDSILFALLGAGIGRGDEVITVAHTFIATIAVIIHCGATPVLVDIGEDYNMDVDLVEKAITPRTRAVLPVYLNGRMCDMDRLMSVAEKHNLLVIEDSAQALGGMYGGKKAGSVGAAGCFSFYPAKSLGAFGDAGIMTTSSPEIAEKARLLRDHGRQNKVDYALFGYNSRLDNLQAAFLNMKFRYYPEWIERRRQIASMYDGGLKEVEEVKLPPAPAASQYYDTYQNYVIAAGNRDGLAAYLHEAGIETMISWTKPLHHNKPLDLGHFKLPVTERICSEVLSLPMYPELDDSQVEYTIDAIQKFYRK